MMVLFSNLLKRRMIEGFLVLISSLLIIPQIIFAQNNGSGQDINTPFNVGEVIERVSHHPVRNGDKIVIKDAVYEAFFDEKGVVLRPRKIKKDAEDIYIPIIGRPEIRDGRVIYQIEDGEVIFEGRFNGLGFKELHNPSPSDYSKIPLSNNLITKYSGNVARLENEKVTEWSREGEFLIDTNVVYVPAAYDQYLLSIAFDGTNYLVVWEDWGGGSSCDIYGTRVRTDGTVLDPSGIAISTAGNSQTAPSVAFDGTNYLVVWMDSRNDYYPYYYIDIYGARVGTDGTVLDPSGIPIALGEYYQTTPSVAFDGTNYLVVWSDDRNGYPDIYGARVGTNGTVLDPSGIAISTAGNSQSSPSIAFDGTNYLVVWSDDRNGSSDDIYGARVGTDGTVLDPSGIAISTAADDQESPSIAFDGTNYLVVWEDFRDNPDTSDIYGARVGTNGTVLDPSGIAISTAADDQRFPSITFDGTNYLVVWPDSRSGSFDIYASRIGTNGTVIDPSGKLISTVVYDQEFPSAAFDGTNYLVVWQDWRSGSYSDIYGARVGTDGTVIDPSGIAVSTAAYDQRSPSVAFDGTNYLVVWADSRSGPSDIYGARVGTDGTVIDPSGIAISTAGNSQTNPSIAFDGTNYLVVWEDGRNNSFSVDIYGARVGTDGTVLDPSGIAISTAGNPQNFPSVAFDGTNYLVVWQDWRNFGNGFDIYGARVGTDGTVIDPSGIAISTLMLGQYSPSVAFDGTNYLVVWKGEGGSSWDIYGARVGTDGTVIDPSGIPISTVPDYQEYPSVIFDGTNYLVVWQDYRSGSSYDIYGAHVNTSGTVIDEIPVSIQNRNQIFPALARGQWGQGSQILVVYSGFVDSVNNHPANTMRIWGKLYPIVGIEEKTLHSTSYAKLLQVYPNPFRNHLTIKFQIPNNFAIRNPQSAISPSLATRYSLLATIRIYDATGRLVKSFSRLTVNGKRSTVIWDGTDDSGRKLPVGVYVVQLETGDYKETEKVILLR